MIDNPTYKGLFVDLGQGANVTIRELSDAWPHDRRQDPRNRDPKTSSPVVRIIHAGLIRLAQGHPDPMFG